MRIAQVAPLSESVPPKLYGGTERVVSYLTEELVAMGHDVTLFASGDSVTSARLKPIVEQALRLDSRCVDSLAPHFLQLETVKRHWRKFDIIHFHTDYLHFPATRAHQLPSVTTLHGRLDIPELMPLYREFNEMPVVSISDHQRSPLPFANWLATVYNGIPADLFRFEPTPGRYLAFLGRISPEKRPDRAIDLAIRFGMQLKIAAKVDKADCEYYETKIKPLLKHPLVEYIGEINDAEKIEFLGGAYALLFPIDWPEPFGLVMIEAMACGTPVIAWRCGSVPEVMVDEVSGFIVDSEADALSALERIAALDRAVCRKAFEKRFTTRHMAEGYVAVYEDFLAGRMRKTSITSTARLAI
ncbi:glycosyltransferase family 4 protein [Methylomicrobium sp. RS1]|jgi:glycosyltransferase involved in cell wall biosynthesis|uniref:glycosyltransferase family 4 protein n=1 Tax=Candidatus Methylomicrobium oryzae TaxID=2802053 RepID=UPI001921DDF2|nr:glycosyltransferase family 4 protein [Methylomicrobium sp. RS1]MBL1263314.1 glycosyltransferase family 4 protein [Methylomicrobium sp. RS1]